MAASVISMRTHAAVTFKILSIFIENAYDETKYKITGDDKHRSGQMAIFL